MEENRELRSRAEEILILLADAQKFRPVVLGNIDRAVLVLCGMAENSRTCRAEDKSRCQHADDLFNCFVFQ